MSGNPFGVVIPPDKGDEDHEVRKTPAEWAAERGSRILDPDGWRMKGAPRFDEPLTYKEFGWRFAMSTVGPLNWGKEKSPDAPREPYAPSSAPNTPPRGSADTDTLPVPVAWLRALTDVPDLNAPQARAKAEVRALLAVGVPAGPVDGGDGSEALRGALAQAAAHAIREYTGTKPGEQMWNYDVEKAGGIQADALLPLVLAYGREQRRQAAEEALRTAFDDEPTL